MITNRDANNHLPSEETPLIQPTFKFSVKVLNTRDKFGRTPIYRAAEVGNSRFLAQVLKTKDINIDAGDKYEMTPLHIAAANGHINCVKLLIQHGARLDKLTFLGETPLHKAAERHHHEIVNYFINFCSGRVMQHTYVNLKAAVDDTGGLKTPLHMALQRFRTEIKEGVLTYVPNSLQNAEVTIRLLHDRTMTLPAVLDEDQQTPLHYLVQHPDIALLSDQLISDLIDCYAVECDRFKCYPLHYAALNPRLPMTIFQRLISVVQRHHIPLSRVDHYHDSPLLLALLVGNDAKVAALLAEGTFNHISKDPLHPVSPLMQVAKMGKTELLKEFQKHGCSFIDKDAVKALTLALYHRHFDTAACLIEFGVNPLVTLKRPPTNPKLRVPENSLLAITEGDTPAHVAIAFNHDSLLVSCLTKKPEMVNAKNAKQESLAAYALRYDRAALSQLLGKIPGFNSDDASLAAEAAALRFSVRDIEILFKPLDIKEFEMERIKKVTFSPSSTSMADRERGHKLFDRSFADINAESKKQTHADGGTALPTLQLKFA